MRVSSYHNLHASLEGKFLRFFSVAAGFDLGSVIQSNFNFSTRNCKRIKNGFIDSFFSIHVTLHYLQESNSSPLAKQSHNIIVNGEVSGAKNAVKGSNLA